METISRTESVRQIYKTQQTTEIIEIFFRIWLGIAAISVSYMTQVIN